jgi:ubiquinone/menaquinone biosynthesis C-methylase UbiE
MNFGKPDETLALANYARLVDGYDASCRRIAQIRAQAIALLGLRPGDGVLDVACGTGTSFPLLYAGVRSTGRIVGVELSPQMCGCARARAEAIDTECIDVIESHAQRADFGATRFDAVLFHYTHDVLRDPAALANVFAAVKPGARVAVAGIKAGALWALPLSLLSIFRARKYLTTFEGLAQPWSHLLRYVPEFRWLSRAAGTGYIGFGRVAVQG